jgi:hypothetical protein
MSIKQFNRRRPTLCLLFTISFFAVSVTTAHAECPDAAHAVVLQQIEAMKERLLISPTSSIFKGELTSEDLSNVTIGRCFVRYWGITDEAFIDANPAELLQIECTVTYFFPIIFEGRCIGSVNVRHDPNNPDSYEPGPRWTAHAILDRVVSLQRQYPAEDNYEVSMFSSASYSFFVIAHKGKLLSITPIYHPYAGALNMAFQQDNKYPIVDIVTGVQTLQNLVKIKLQPSQD